MPAIMHVLPCHPEARGTCELHCDDHVMRNADYLRRLQYNPQMLPPSA